ncbi:hypothetical protein N9D31_03605 [Oligoflexaceae bacterium]|nr:hypothetical protein [Oligoflexaceae bacterium]
MKNLIIISVAWSILSGIAAAETTEKTTCKAVHNDVHYTVEKSVLKTNLAQFPGEEPRLIPIVRVTRDDGNIYYSYQVERSTTAIAAPTAENRLGLDVSEQVWIEVANVVDSNDATQEFSAVFYCEKTTMNVAVDSVQ